MVLGNLGIASQWLRMVVVVSYFYYSLFYTLFGWCCDGVSNAQAFATILHTLNIVSLKKPNLSI
jgi:hypothetical protein